MIEKRLNELIPTDNQTLFEAARYALLSPGKRLRPQLVLATAESFGGLSATALDPACALEMVHCYSLIHDDLPCMDDDDVRRGKPSLHKVFGEAMALLAGDYLLTYSFEMIANSKHLSAEQKIQMVQILAKRAGAPGLIGGQAIDIESTAKQVDEVTLLEMHSGKTASLIIACLEVGAIAASQTPFPLLQSIGLDLGLAYQFRDDLVDFEEQSDARMKKSTAITAYGFQETRKKLEDLEASLFLRLNELFPKTSPLKSLIGNILHKI